MYSPISFYASGTASVTKDSAIVTGVDTTWLSKASVGQKITFDLIVNYTISSVDSDTQLTLSTAYQEYSKVSHRYIIAAASDLTTIASHTYNDSGIVIDVNTDPKYEIDNSTASLTTPTTIYLADIITGNDGDGISVNAELAPSLLSILPNATQDFTGTLGGVPVSEFVSKLSNATVAYDYVNKVTSDLLISVSEKPDLASAWGVIQGEYSTIHGVAVSLNLGSDSESTTYTNTYNDLNSFITPILANMNADSSTIVGQLRLKTQSYYTARSLLVAKLALEASTTSDWNKTYGQGKPQSYATVGAPAGTNVGTTPATQIESGVASAINTLISYAADNQIVPLEKREYKKDWDLSVGEYDTIIAQTPSSITTQKQAFIDAFTALQTYFTTTQFNKIVGSEILTATETFFQDMSTTISVDGAQLKGLLNTYKITRSTLLTKIASTAHSTATTVATGTQNYLKTTEPNGVFSISTMSIVDNANATREVTLHWSYVQGSTPADFVHLYYKEGSGTITNTNSFIALSPTTTSHKFQVSPDKEYVAGIAAAKKADSGIIVSAITQPSGWHVTPGQVDFTGNLAGANSADLVAAHNTTVAAVGDIFNAGKLTSADKQSLNKLWQSMKAEYTTLVALAQDSRYASTVGTALSAYQTSYNTLFNFLEGDGGPLTPALIGATTTINQATIESYIADFVNKRQLLNNAVHNASMDKATTALTNANQALANATAAVASLQAMVSDHSLSPSDKQAIKAEIDTKITPVYQPNVDTATALNITTEKTNYTNAYNALIAAFSPYLADLATASDITGQETALTTAYQNYYNTEALLTSKFSTTSYNAALAAQTAANLVTTNFNNSNDRNSAAISAPTNVSMSCAVQKSGTADVIISWSWAGNNGDIDGFIIYARVASTNAAYTIGTTPATEVAWIEPADKRGHIEYGVAADQFVTVGIAAYRSVDKDINSAGRITSTVAQYGPYQPATNVNFTGTVAGTNAATVVSNVNTAYNFALTMANDGVLSAAVEKQSLRNDWEVLYGERAGLLAQATSLGVSSTTYSTSFQTFADYLNRNASTGLAGSAWTTGVPNWITDTNLSVDTPIVDVVGYRAVITDIVIQRGALINALVAASATKADYVNVTNKPTNLSAINSAEGTKLTGIATGATKNLITVNTVDPSGGAAGDFWYNSVTGKLYTNNAGSWQLSSTNNKATSGTVLPSSGTDGDVFLKTDTGVLYTRVGTVWTAGATYNQANSGTGTPTGGTSGDTYYNTSTGVLWTNVAGTWTQSADKTSLNTAADTSKVGGVNSSTVLTNATNGATAFSGTVNLRDTTLPNGTFTPSAASVTANTVGGRDITLSWSAYTQGSSKATHLVLYYDTVLPTTASPSIQLDINSTSHRFLNVDATKAYQASLVAVRIGDGVRYMQTLPGTANWTVSAGTATNTATSVSWANVASAPANLTALTGVEAIKNALITINSNGSLSGAGGGSVTIGGLGYTGDLAATKNIITSGTVAPASPANGDIWVDTNAPVTVKTRIAGAWVASGNIATTLAQVDTAADTKLTGIATGATKNTVSTGILSARPTGSSGDFYYATDTSILYQNIGGTWTTSATVGAPAGTLVGGTSATTVETQAATGNTAATETATFRTDGPPTNQPVLGSVTSSAISAGGTVDIIVNWTYTQGTLPADGFRIHSNLGSTTPTLASPPSGVVGPNDRSFTFRGVPADKNYRAGIVAFRNVPATNGVGGQRENAMVTGWAYTAQTVSLDAASLGGSTAATINTNITTAGTTATWSGVTGTGKPADNATVGAPSGTNVGSTAATTVETNSANGASAFSETVKYRSAGAPTNAPSPTGATITDNNVGGRNIRVDWGAYTQGTNQADFLLLFYKEGSGTPTINDACLQFNVNTLASYHLFQNVDVTKAYTCGIAAARRTENGLEIGTIVTHAQWTVAAGTVNNTATGATFGLGVNLLPNTEFANDNILPWAIGWNPDGAVISNWGSSKSLLGASWNPTNQNALFVQQTGRTAGTTSDVCCDIYPFGADAYQTYGIIPGERYEFSAWVAAARCKFGLGLYFYDINNVSISGADTGAMTVNTGGTNFAAYDRIGVFATVPANARKAVVFFRKFNTAVGQTDSYVWIVRPYLGIALPTQTAFSPYVPGVKNATEGAPAGTKVGNTASTTVETQANAGNTAANDTATFRNTGFPSNQPVLGSVTTSAISAGGTVDITLTWTYTQGALPADGFIIYSNQGTTAPTISSPVGGVVGANDRSFTFRGVPADKDYRAGIVAFRYTPSNSTIPGQKQNAIVTGWAYTAQTVSLSAASVPFTGVSGVPYDKIYTADDANRLGFNNTFSLWSGAATETAPDNWTIQIGTAAISRETTITKTGRYALKFTVASGDSYVKASYLSSAPQPATLAVSGSFDVYLQARTSGLPGMLIDVLDTAGGILSRTHFQPNSTVTGQWQNVPFLVRGNGTTAIGGISIWVMGSWNGFASGSFVGTAIFGGFSFNVVTKDVDNKQQQATDIQGGIGNISGQLDASVKLLDASLTAAKTAISAINSSTGNLNTNQLAALQAMVGSLSALSASLGTVTAGTLDTTGYVRARGAISVDGYNAAIVGNDSLTQPIGVYGKGTLIGGAFVANGLSYAAGVQGSSNVGWGCYGYTNSGRAVFGYANAAGGTAVYADAVNGARALYVSGESAYTGVADFYNGIRFSSNNTLKFNWGGDFTVAPKATLAGKTHQAWITFWVDSTLFKIPLYQD